MRQSLRTSLVFLVLYTLLCGVLYPAVVTGVSQLVWHEKANGSLLRQGDRFIGSELIGQPFASAHYFWSRPSATPMHPYDGGASSGSNWGPSNPALNEAVTQRLNALRAGDPWHTVRWPVDLVTASASGLDPHISVAAALSQVARVARERDLEPEQVNALVREFTEGSTVELLGPPRVHVLHLNLALDALSVGGEPGQP